MKFEEFETIAREAFPGIAPEQLDKFRQLESLYNEWNSRINVISRKDIDGLYSHHVLHSLSIAVFLKNVYPELYECLSAGKDGQRETVLDLGTGGGFPGIPLAILFPEARFTLCDSVNKKIIVASSVSHELQLDNVETIHDRAENLNGKFGFIVSRAVTSLDNFMGFVKNKYRKGILYLKGGNIAEEISQAARKTGFNPKQASVWPVGNWLKEEYFKEKFVIFIKNPLQIK